MSYLPRYFIGFLRTTQVGHASACAGETGEILYHILDLVIDSDRDQLPFPNPADAVQTRALETERDGDAICAAAHLIYVVYILHMWQPKPQRPSACVSLPKSACWGWVAWGS